MLHALRRTGARSLGNIPCVLSRAPYNLGHLKGIAIMAATKRKASAVEVPKPLSNGDVPLLKRRASARKASTMVAPATVNPDINGEILDGPEAARASPDGDTNTEIAPSLVKKEDRAGSESPLSDAPDVVQPPKKRGRGKIAKAEKDVHQAEEVVSAVVDAASKSKPAPAKKGRGKQVKQEDGGTEAPAKAVTAKAKKNTDEEPRDPEADDDEEAGEEEVQEALSRLPPVNSEFLPLPWKGRLGYACLNTYLRQSNPPVFSSRTCRIQSILEHRHPLQDPSQPEHPTKNRPDRTKPADVELGMRYLEAICLANVRDIGKMIRWNDRYNIKFMRLSSEMFPFASHPEYGYKLAPFASEALAEAGKVIAQYGHRVTTHPGQFTQLGSPRKQVIDNAFRDLEYHDELLSLLKLPEQQNKDAVMILHMGGMFEGKAETIARFKENYAKLSQSVKNRLVLENDDMGWSVHDIFPVCEELNIPLVLDYHHHNIVFDASQIREGTRDIMDLYPRITATWQKKGITQKMHYSEPTPPAITPRQRRKHNPRVATLPPCAPDMDLMIEAKDKEQAVFELMRTFKLPGYDTFNDILPYTRNDDNKVALAAMNKKPTKKTKKKAAAEEEAEKEEEDSKPDLVPEHDIGMGGPEGRVYWPPGMEEWLRPKKREVKKKDPVELAENKKEKAKKDAAAAYAAREAEKANGGNVKVEESESDIDATPATKKAKAAMRKKENANKIKAAAKAEEMEARRLGKEAGVNVKSEKKPAAKGGRKAKVKKEEVEEEEEEQAVLTPSASEEDEELELGDEEEEERVSTPALKRRGAAAAGARRTNGRQAKAKKVSYAEDEDEDEDMGEA